MSKYFIDSDKVEESAVAIKSHVTEIDKLLEAYVKRMQKVPNETKEWQGNAAEDFVTIIKTEYEKDYMPLMSCIRKYADELQQASEDYKSVIKENRLQ